MNLGFIFGFGVGRGAFRSFGDVVGDCGGGAVGGGEALAAVGWGRGGVGEHDGGPGAVFGRYSGYGDGF